MVFNFAIRNQNPEHLRGIFRYLTSGKTAGIGTSTTFARFPSTAGKWTGVFSTEVDWVQE